MSPLNFAIRLKASVAFAPSLSGNVAVVVSRFIPSVTNLWANASPKPTNTICPLAPPLSPEISTWAHAVPSG